MHPWYRGYTGEISIKSVSPLPNGGNVITYTLTGTVEIVDDNTIMITELPVGKWTTDYKQLLETMLIGNNTVKAADKTENPADKPDNSNINLIKDFKENHTDTSVLFTVTLPAEKLQEIMNDKGGLIKRFKLETSVTTSNMHMFDMNGIIRKFDGPLDVLHAFYTVRLSFYEKRKTYLISKLTDEWDRLDNKVKFIQSVIDGKLVISNRKKQELLFELQSKGFKTFIDKISQISLPSASHNDDSDNESIVTVATTASETTSQLNLLERGYDYLLSMKIWSLTKERIQELVNQKNSKFNELNQLKIKKCEDLWLDDLNELENQLHEFEKAFELSTQTIIKGSKKNSKAIVRKQTSSLVVNNITSTSTLPVSQTTRVISKPITKTLSNVPSVKLQKKISKSKRSLDDDDVDDEESDDISVYSDDRDSDDFLEDNSDEEVVSKTKKIIKAVKAKQIPTTRQPLAEKSLNNIVKSKSTVIKKVENKQSNLAQETMSLLERIRAKTSVSKDTSSNVVDLSSDIEDNIYNSNKSSNKPTKVIKLNNLKNVQSKSQTDDLIDSDEGEDENDSFSDVSSDESYHSESKSKLKKVKDIISKAVKTVDKPTKAKKPPSKIIDKLTEKGTKRPKKNNYSNNAVVEVYTPDIPTPQPVKKQRKNQDVIPSKKSKVKKIINSDSESEDDDIYSESDGEFVKAIDKPLRNRKPTNYAVYYDNDSENDEDDD
eukprot:gene23441-30384_t